MVFTPLLHSGVGSSILHLPTKFISVKCYLVASAVWGRVVQVRILVGRPKFYAWLVFNGLASLASTQ